METYGKSYNEEIDGERIHKQYERIRDFMLGCEWRTLAEIAAALDYPEASISAQLRHLRKRIFGGYDVQKQRRTPEGGTWEYRVRGKMAETLFEGV